MNQADVHEAEIHQTGVNHQSSEIKAPNFILLYTKHRICLSE